jgi:hyperosmotically inducible periplasmic protein
MQIRRILFASGIVLAIAVMSGSAAAAPAPASSLADARQESQIWTTYALNPYLRAAELKVSVHSGTATLTGKVEEGAHKELAMQIALGVDGIRDVDNEIVVTPDYRAPDRRLDRSYGEAIDDVTISAAVKSKLVWSRYMDGLAIDVSTRWGRVSSP